MSSFFLPAATLWQRELVRFWRQKSRVMGVVGCWSGDQTFKHPCDGMKDPIFIEGPVPRDAGVRHEALLARMEVNSFFTELLPRLKTIELKGNPELISTTFVGGLKHLPIRYQVR